MFPALHPAERERLLSLREGRRRDDWLCGRLVAKEVVRDVLAEQGLRLPASDELEIANLPSGAPIVRERGAVLPVALSISHSRARALCAAAWADGVRLRLGTDLEWIEPRDPSFLETFFDDREQRLVDLTRPADRPALVTVLWTAKEAVLKALGVGLSVDTRSVSCTPEERPTTPGWRAFAVAGAACDGLRGWWRVENNFALAVAADDDGHEPS